MNPRPFGKAAAAFRKVREAWEELQRSYLAGDSSGFKRTRAEWAAALAGFSDAVGDLRQLHNESLKQWLRDADNLRRAKSRPAPSLGASGRPRRKRARARAAASR